MPTYVYECAKCGDEFELWQSFTDEPLKRHRGGCGGKVAKVIQPAGIVLKGAGFYRNDSRGASKGAKREKSDAGASASDSKSSGSGSDGGATGDKGSKSATTSKDGAGTSKSSSGKAPATSSST